MKAKKKLGIGSVSLLLLLIALLWSSNLPFENGLCLGDYVLTCLRLPTWSNGTSGMHYTIWYALIALIPAYLLGKKHEEHLFALSGKWISGALTVYLVVMHIVLIVI